MHSEDKLVLSAMDRKDTDSGIEPELQPLHHIILGMGQPICGPQIKYQGLFLVFIYSY